jgi:hypothetical protein
VKIAIEDILRARSVGRLQSVGPMQVIPILGEDDDAFAPPTVEAGTIAYGTVQVRNLADKPTIVPPGTAWVVKQAAQDHAIAAGVLVGGKSERTIERAMCVQQSQPGLFAVESRPMQMLPAALRVVALELREASELGRLWPHIGHLKEQHGLSTTGNLVDFLSAFERELDGFVAQFERVPGQIGAIILIGGAVAGVELAPSAAYWSEVWVPLVRVCYGALALAAARAGGGPPPTRVPLDVRERSVAAIRAALARADADELRVVSEVVHSLAGRSVSASGTADSLAGFTLHTVAGRELVGQVLVGKKGKPIPFASLVARGAAKP